MRAPGQGPHARVDLHGPRRLQLALLAAYMLLAAVLAHRQGQDVNWDLRNYHFYGPYAALEGRLDIDVLGAGVQTFLNPILNFPLYFAVRAPVSPMTFGLTLAALHGVALWCVHRVTVLTAAEAPRRIAHVAGGLAAVTAAFGAGFYGELGTTIGDAVIATFVLAAVMVVLEQCEAPARLFKACLIAGLLVGLAAGAKQVGGIYAFGLLAMIALAADSHRRRVVCATGFLCALAVGLLVTGGYWMWLMYDRFGSPVFPFYNLIARSPWAPLRDFSTEVFGILPSRSMPSLLPFLFTSKGMLAAEVPFRDARLAAAWVGILALGTLALVRRLRNLPAARDIAWKRLVMLSGFFVVSYVVWGHTLTLYRFAMPLELLSGTIVVGLILRTESRRGVQMAAAAAVCATLVVTTIPFDFGRIPWKGDYFGVSDADFAEFEGATIVLADFPTAYLVPFFPTSTVFLRVASNWGLQTDSLMRRLAHQRLAEAPADRRFVLARANDLMTARTEKALTGLGMAIDTTTCTSFRSHLEDTRICRLVGR